MAHFTQRQKKTIRGAMVVILLAEEEERAAVEERRRKIWAREWLKRRTEGSQYNNRVQELALEDEDGVQELDRSELAQSESTPYRMSTLEAF